MPEIALSFFPYSQRSYQAPLRSLRDFDMFFGYHTANILTVLSTAFGSVTYATVIWLHKLQLKIAIDFKLYSSVSLNVIFTVVD